MDAFIALTPDDQKLYCEQASATLGLAPVSVEKDFWVCWTLRELFRLPGRGAHLTFKGGTSLSKSWGLIERFSEDIDIVIERDFLGFGGDKSPEAAPSAKQQKIRLKALKAACSQRIQAELLPALDVQFRTALPANASWSLELASLEEDADQQTLLFRYPTVFGSGAGYVQQLVRIELGARSDIEPSETPTVQPYVHKALSTVLGPGTFAVKAVAPERTFLEKAMLLHEETFRPADKHRKPRMARHYYDLWCLIQKGIARRALDSKDLFERVVSHRSTFFHLSWVDYSTLRRGTIRLVPLDKQRAEWRQDYQAMHGEMFFGTPPEFDEIMRVVHEFEYEINRTGVVRNE